MQQTSDNRVLVLNASYEPIHICTVPRAIIMTIKGVAVNEDMTDRYIHSPSIALPVPSVIRLRHFVRIPTRRRLYSKRSIFLRDNFICQYCGKKFEPAKLTLDHVLPVSRGGQSSWTNLVTSCNDCNRKKGDQTPKEAGIRLLSNPRTTTHYFDLYLLRYRGQHNQAWRKYLYFEHNGALRPDEDYDA